jgi:hypothetical protein
MDYGKLLSRAWHIIWEHKFLILLGVIVALGSSHGGTGSPGGGGFRGDRPSGEFDWQQPPFEFPEEFPELDEFEREYGRAAPIFGIILAILILGVVIVIALALWSVATIARGGLIDAVHVIEAGGMSNFSQAWQAGWRHGWQLLGIGILPALPMLVLTIGGLGMTGMLTGFTGLFGWRAAAFSGLGGLIGVFGALACIAMPLVLVLSLLQTFANRACMFEDLGVFASYRRGWDVLIDNIGTVLVLFLIQVLINVMLGLVLRGIGFLLILCCFMWPVLLLIQGAIAAFFSTIWTLAWGEWTGEWSGRAAAPVTMEDVG